MDKVMTTIYASSSNPTTPSSIFVLVKDCFLENGTYPSILIKHNGNINIRVSGRNHSTIVNGGVVVGYLLCEPMRRLFYSRLLRHVVKRRRVPTYVDTLSFMTFSTGQKNCGKQNDNCGIASVVVASLEAEVNTTNSEIALVHLPKQLQKAAEEVEKAKSLAQTTREELQKAMEEAE
ncbi:hypothetical protein LguiA_033909 [Lonicera macranthoides]